MKDRHSAEHNVTRQSSGLVGESATENLTTAELKPGVTSGTETLSSKQLLSGITTRYLRLAVLANVLYCSPMQVIHIVGIHATL